MTIFNPRTNQATGQGRHRFRTAMLAGPVAILLGVTASGTMAETARFDSAGVPIHFTDEGTGEAVIFLHGFAGASTMWSAVGLMPLDGFRTIAFDARGHGESGKPEDAASYGDELIGDVIRLMDHLGVAEAHIVGFSMGSETALRLAADYPDRVLSVVAAGSGMSGPVEAGAYGFIAAALGATDTFGGFMADMSPPDQVLTDAEQAGMMALLEAHGIDPRQSAVPLAAFAASLPAIISLDAAALASITMPVLGIAGELDPERDNVEALAGALADARVVVIPEADHLMTPVSAQFGETIRAFLAE